MFQSDKAQRLGLLLIRGSTLAAFLVVLNAGVLFGLELADAPRRYEALAIPILVVLPVACFLWLLGTFVLCLVPDNRAKVSFALGLLASLLMTSCFDLDRWADLVGHDHTPGVFSVATCAAIVLVLAGFSRLSRVWKRPDLVGESRITMVYGVVAWGLALNLFYGKYQQAEILGLIICAVGLVGLMRFSVLLKRLSGQVAQARVEARGQATQSVEL